MTFIENQEWRYATKKFDPTKKVSPKHLEFIKRAIQLSVSSYGLQLYKVLIIEDKHTLKQLRSASWDQSQITDASHLFVFCNYTDAVPEAIDSYIQQTAETRNIELKELKGYADFMKTKVAEKSEVEQFNWTKNQTYIALANLLSACAELKIDACPMEGFESERYNDILGLTEKGLNASVIAPIGYRNNNDQTQYLQKVRRPLETLFELM